MRPTGKRSNTSRGTRSGRSGRRLAPAVLVACPAARPCPRPWTFSPSGASPRFPCSCDEGAWVDYRTQVMAGGRREQGLTRIVCLDRDRRQRRRVLVPGDAAPGRSGPTARLTPCRARACGCGSRGAWPAEGQPAGRRAARLVQWQDGQPAGDLPARNCARTPWWPPPWRRVRARPRSSADGHDHAGHRRARSSCATSSCSRPPTPRAPTCRPAA